MIAETKIEISGNSNLLMKNVLSIRTEVGNTPLYPVKNLFSKKGVQLYAKQEWKQLSGSVKCRPAYSIIKDAIASGKLNERKTLLDASSGNTGIAYAAIGARLGIKVSICLPENASKERKDLLELFGAEIIFTSRFEGTDGAQEVAKDLSERFPEKYYYANQYSNINNLKAHYHTTATEIMTSVPAVTHFVCGLGTTGTFTGTGKRLKEWDETIKLVALQPDSAMHALEGWKHLETAVVPAIYNSNLADENAEVSTEEAYEILKAAAKYEGMLLSPSSAANLAGAIRIANQIEQGVVVTILPDNADRYNEVIKQIF